MDPGVFDLVAILASHRLFRQRPRALIRFRTGTDLGRNV